MMIALDRVCCGVVHTDCEDSPILVVGACCICSTKDAAKGRTTKNLLAREDK